MRIGLGLWRQQELWRFLQLELWPMLWQRPELENRPWQKLWRQIEL
jgi:hypothetical protein